MVKKPFKLFFIILSLVMVFALGACKKQASGTVTIEYYSLDSATVTKTVTVEFREEDTLASLIEANFSNVEFGTGSNAGMIMNIEDYVQPVVSGVVDWSTYVSFEVNGEYALSGILSTPLTDGYTYSFKAMTSSW